MHASLPILVSSVLALSLIAGCLGMGSLEGTAPVATGNVAPDPDDPYTFTFDASASRGHEITHSWEFGDRTVVNQSVARHTYTYGDGTYTARLTVTDATGAQAHWEKEIVVGDGENNPPQATFRLDKRIYATGEPIRVDASRSFDPDGGPLEFSWDFNHLMDFNEYEAFRAAKAQAAKDDSEESFVTAPGPELHSPLPLAPPHDLPEPRDLVGPKHHHDRNPDTGRVDHSTFSHTAHTLEPVYVLEDGLPDETVFFIKLTVYDVKNGHDEIRSTEIWPVEIHASPPRSTTSDSTQGSFDLGAGGAVTDLFNDAGLDEHIAYKHQWTFPLDWPIAPGVRDGLDYHPAGFINLTWDTEHPLEATLHMNVTAPNGRSFDGRESSRGLLAELDGNTDYGTGTWTVALIARSGIEIDWQLSYWTNLTLNPFLVHEAEYL